MSNTTPTTPLTADELHELDTCHFPTSIESRAAAQIRALRAERDDLLAALKDMINATAGVGTEHSYHYAGDRRIENFRNSCPFCIARAAIARAEGRAEG